MNANEEAIRKAYQVAEDKDVVGWVNCFTENGTFTDESIGVTYRGELFARVSAGSRADARVAVDAAAKAFAGPNGRE